MAIIVIPISGELGEIISVSGAFEIPSGELGSVPDMWEDKPEVGLQIVPITIVENEKRNDFDVN